MTIETGKTYRTKLRHQVKIYSTGNGGAWPVHGAVYNGFSWDPQQWTDQGGARGNDTSFDLIYVPKRLTGVAAISDKNVFPSMDAAKEFLGEHREGCSLVYVDIEVGEGLK